MTAVAATPRRTFGLVHGDISFHGLVNTYSRIVFGKAHIQIILLHGVDDWIVQTDYGPGPNEYYAEAHIAEGTAMLAFLSEVVKWEKLPDELFVLRVQHLLKRRRKKGRSQ